MSDTRKVIKTNDQWQEALTDQQYQVCRCGATEPPFSGEYYNNKQAGTYHCVACSRQLFSSKDKFDSGTGWPSFSRSIDQECVEMKEDQSHEMIRTEVLCAGCESHLGHVFKESSIPTGHRFCINSTSLKFVPKSV